MNSNASSDSPHTVVPSEVGWQFVPQYYTFVNKQPNRLHCFYTKSSTFIHGTEGEDGKPCFGQQEIHSKITSIGFEDCKVFIHSVDAQSSANGGIIIQVIGEMSNRGEPWRKFVQTFFLAEQPNGYFVLNDIFRFLKEETVEEDSDADPATETARPASETTSTPSSPAPAPAPAPTVDVVPIEPEEATPATPPSAPEPVPEPVEELVAPPSPTEEVAPVTETNGHAEPEKEDAPEPVSPAENQATPAPPPAAEPPAPPPAPVTPVPAASPAPPTAPPAQPAPVATPAPAPVPSAPKTWANLAAANSKKWGSAVAQESRGTSEAPAPSSSTPGSGAQTPTHPGPGPGPGPATRPRELSPAYTAAQGIQNPQCFAKSVQENVSEAALRHTLTSRFGPIKELEIVRSKACAFLEFVTVDAAKRAIIASLPPREGGEGGIRVDVGDGQTMLIRIEIRKERGERPVSRPRGGPPMNGGDRGSFRGRGGPGRGRGIGAK